MSGSPWQGPKLGFFSFCLLVGICSWPFYELGLGDTASIIIGVVLAIGVVIAAHAWHREARIEEMREAQGTWDGER